MDHSISRGTRFRKASRSRLVSEDEQQDSSSSTDENEFSFTSEAVNETDV